RHCPRRRVGLWPCRRDFNIQPRRKPAVALASRCANESWTRLGRVAVATPNIAGMTLISNPTETRAPPPSESTGSKIKKALGPIGVTGVDFLTVIGNIKSVLLILLTTGGSMV